MRRLLSAALSLAVAGFASAQAAVIAVETDDTSVMVGDIVDFRITFTADDPAEYLAEYFLELFYDDTALAFAGVSFLDPATGINQVDPPVTSEFIADFGADAIDGIVDLFGITGNSDATLAAVQADDFVIATVSFLAYAVSSASDIGLDTIISDLGGDLDVEFGDDVVTIEVVPLPGALVFFLTGLAGLAARRRLA
ncbi:hypothetical protein [Parvularcula dongshanensis]|uniref:PEP-CTERM sorting domain-containing protein n=1 Tax=Parvularcula dongshanensis TaxID=1173995 RepID=A0A840I596_9PROT|nr:hypothetical protein [Parvularcula dongshanensis]MBB4659552.1 hypothetical protein [Parvularcula dongshanensis]